MKTLDLGKLYNVVMYISQKQEDLWEEDKYYQLFGNLNGVSHVSFMEFLDRFTLKFVIVYEELCRVDLRYSYYIDMDYEIEEEMRVPIQFLTFTPEELDSAIEEEIKRQYQKVIDDAKKDLESAKTSLELAERVWKEVNEELK